MADARSIVERYHAAFARKDFDTGRRLLHDDLSFRGPIDTFCDADAYIEAIRGLSRIVRGVEVQRIVADGQDVAVFYDLVTATPAGTAPVAEWFHVEGDAISAIRAYFDARPFAPPAGA
jgi:limonene-1,2-epoxide hydrolase